MTRRERLEAKLAKREQWARSRDAKYSERREAARNTALPPMGEPIKIGHHSEKRHRKAFADYECRMRKAMEHADMADYHRAKADGLACQLDKAIFSDDPDALEQIAARVAELREKQEKRKATNKAFKAAVKAKDPAPLIAMGYSEEIARQMITPDDRGRLEIPFPSYSLQNNNANIRRLEKRAEEIKARHSHMAKVESAGGVLIQDRPGERCMVTFSEKPARNILDALKAAGFAWGGIGWSGPRAALPMEVATMAK